MLTMCDEETTDGYDVQRLSDMRDKQRGPAEF